MTDADERSRGILTPKDRALLRGEIEYDHPQQYSNRYNDIRERITNGLLDFSLIQYTLRDRDRKRIFQDPDRAAGTSNAQLSESLQSLLYWVYLGLKEQNYDFEGLLIQAIEEAEAKYARKYRGESVDVRVTYDVDVKRSQDIGDLIRRIEEGGPIPANRLYNLLQLSGGVPIDTSKLDVLRVWFQSSYPEGERAVLETLFSEYLGVDIEIVDAELRVQLDDPDLRKDSAVIEGDSPRPDPSQIKNYTQPMIRNSGESLEQLRIEANRSRSKEPDTGGSGEDESILGNVFNDLFEREDESAPSIEDIIQEENKPQRAISPDSVVELLETVSEPFVSTGDVAAAFGSDSEDARQSLLEATEDSRISRHSVRDTADNQLDIWQISSMPTSGE